MDTQIPQNTTSPVATPEQKMLLEIYENTRKTKNYMKWQLIITVALVVLPLIAMVVIVPFLFNSLSSTYGSLLQ